MRTCVLSVLLIERQRPLQCYQHLEASLFVSLDRVGINEDLGDLPINHLADTLAKRERIIPDLKNFPSIITLCVLDTS